MGGELSMGRIVETFFTLSHSLWSCGLFETTFDFLRNCGMTRDGKPFFIDLGDFTDDREYACALLRSRRWEKRRDYGALGSDTKQLFNEMASQHLTTSRLGGLWRSGSEELVV